MGWGDAGTLGGGVKKERGNMRREIRANIRKRRNIHMVISQGVRHQTLLREKGLSLGTGARCLSSIL